MFEDSTFETNGTIRTRSRNWMLATFAFNGSVLLALVVFPLILPQALPRPTIPNLVDMLLPPHGPQQQPRQPAHAAPAAPTALPKLSTRSFRASLVRLARSPILSRV